MASTNRVSANPVATPIIDNNANAPTDEYEEEEEEVVEGVVHECAVASQNATQPAPIPPPPLPPTNDAAPTAPEDQNENVQKPKKAAKRKSAAKRVKTPKADQEEGEAEEDAEANNDDGSNNTKPKKKRTADAPARKGSKKPRSDAPKKGHATVSSAAKKRKLTERAVKLNDALAKVQKELSELGDA